MEKTMNPFVIVGAGLAGAKAAQTPRDEGLRRPGRAAGRGTRAPVRAPAAVQGPLATGPGRHDDANRRRRRCGTAVSIAIRRTVTRFASARGGDARAQTRNWLINRILAVAHETRCATPWARDARQRRPVGHA